MIQATRTDIDDAASATPPPRRRGRISELHRVREEMPDVYKKMLSLMRSGAFCITAAGAMGVTPETFSRWYHRGRREKAGDYHQFYQDVRKAIAQARVLAEMKVYQSDPRLWLRCGPGRMLGDEWQEKSAKRDEMAAVMNRVQPDDRPADNALPAGPTLIDTLTQLRDAGFIEFNDHTRAMIAEAERSHGS